MFKHATKWSVMLAALMLSLASAQFVFAADKPFADKKIVLQISDGDPTKQTLVLNVANNLIKEYGADKVDIQVVAFGPGARLLFADNANAGRIKALVDSAGVGFHACSNTIKNMTKQLGEKPEINPLATEDSPGIVRIVTLVENGYTLVKP